ncbi:MAG TPA: TlpA disulfide reductase family protein [Methylomirabilota bacterium]|nr:TlpA disulfide reductase family protein [Methylomirabilota bacterium]
MGPRHRLVLAVALTLAVGAAPGPGRADSPPDAPGLRVELLNFSRVVDSRELTGKKVLVVRFQASYCRPCAKESRAFGRLVDRYRGQNVEFVALHVQDTVADTRKFMRAQRVAYPIALDPQLTIGNRFGFKGTPYTVVMDLKGELVARLHGESALTRLPAILDEALREAPPGS